MKITKADVIRALVKDAKDPKSLIIKAILATALTGGSVAYLAIKEAIGNQSGKRSGGNVQRLTTLLSDARRDQSRKETNALLTSRRADEVTEQLMALLRGVQSSEQAAKDAAKVTKQRESDLMGAIAERAKARAAIASSIGIDEKPGGANLTGVGTPDISQFDLGKLVSDPGQLMAVLMALMATQGKSDDKSKATEPMTDSAAAGEVVVGEEDKDQSKGA